MSNQDSSNDVTRNIKEEEEILIPYNQTLLIAWNKDIGARLKDLRTAKGISQAKLAELTSGVVSYDTVTSLEQGRIESVSREKLDALLSHLDSDVRSLLRTVTLKKG